MSYQRAFSTLGCAELSLPDAIALAAARGLDGIELRAVGGTIDLPAYLASHYRSPEELARRLAPLRLPIVTVDTSFRIAGADGGGRDALLDYVPWAEALGVRWLRVFDGTAGDGGTPEAVATLGWWRDLRRERGWRVDCIVETHDSLLSSPRIASLLAAAPGTRILWDTHHTWKLHGEDPLATWRAIGAHIAHIHVKDSISQPSAEYPFTYVPPGAGEFPMAPLARLLRDEYRGVVCLEWERLWHPYLAPLEAALDAAAVAHWW